jgi:hypothetical protein
MKRVSCCSGSFLTTDGAADALDNSEMFEIPAVNNYGKPVIVHILAGDLYRPLHLQ